MLSQHIPLFVGRSPGKEVGIGVCVSELPPVIHSTTKAECGR